MSQLKIFLGDKGKTGSSGETGLGVADVDSFNLSEPLIDCLNTNDLASNALITYDRTGRSSYENMYGENKWARQSNTTNYIYWSSNLFNWSDTFSRWSFIGTTADPFGGNEASEINLDIDTDSLSGNGEVAELIVNVPTQQMMTLSFYVKVISGTVSSLDFVVGSKKFNLPSPTSDWVRVSYPVWVGTSFILSINPRGLTGARVGLYGIQLENNNTATDLIHTSGVIRNIDFDGNIFKHNATGLLLEESKTNLIKNSNNLSEWTFTNGTVGNYEGADPFGFLSQAISIVYSSLPEIIIETATDALTPGLTYKVSVYAFITGGSLQEVKFSLGGGAEVILPQISVTGFQRISLDCIAGNEDDLTVTITSSNLTAKLLLSSFQVESGDLSSYVLTGSQTVARDQDLVSMPYSYNAPKPSGNWSFIFRKGYMLNTASNKTVFSNGESGVNEFSLIYNERNLTINNGGNTSTVDAFDYDKVAVTYDGVDVKFYGEKSLLKTEALSSTSFIATTLYLGSNGSDEFINSYLSMCMLYDTTLSFNEINYLMGA